jgi:cytochrome b pre-mRNA-processing protein 3
MIFGLFRPDRDKAAVERLYGELVAASRQPVLYAALGVPDSLEGRFESLTLHLALVQRRLKAIGASAARVAQLLTDCFFADLDSAMREIGVGDLGVPRKMKTLAGAYFGRMAAYDAMLEPGGEPEATLARNLLGLGLAPDQPDKAAAIAAYVGRIATALSVRDLAGILALGAADFAALAEPPVTSAEATR